MNARTVLLVLRKELLDFIRDRRAVLLIFVLPLVLYPVLIVGFHYAMLIQLQVLEKKTAKVWVSDLAKLPRGLRAELEKHERHLSLEDEPAGADEKAALDRGKVRAILHAPPDLEAQVARVTSRVAIEVVFNGGLDASSEALHKVDDALAAWRHDVVRRRLSDRGLDPALLEPVVAEPRDVAPPGALLGRVLATFLVLTSLMSAFYPAIDLGAGEKERGTLETLLLAPARRIEIALGKFLAVAAVATASALVNLASLGITFTHFLSLASGGALAASFGSISITLPILLPMLATLVPLVALFSALALAIATHATSYKEATTYLQPLAIVASLLSMASALPGIELTTSAALVPVAGVALLFKELLGATARPEHVVLVVGSSFVYAALALAWVVHIYAQEDVLARPATVLGLELFRRPRPGERRVPSFAQGIAAALLALLLLWFVGERLQRKGHALEGLAATLVVLIAAPALLWARTLRLDLRETFRLRPPPVRALVSAALIAAAGSVLGRDVTWLQTSITGEPLPQLEEAWGQLLAQLMSHGPLVALFLIALLPAICEELLFRGFVLTGLRTRLGPFAAALVSAALFAVVHLDPVRLSATASLGFLLALLVLRSESIVPAVFAHFVHNGLVLAMALRGDTLVAHGLLANGLPSWPLRAVALATLAAGLALLFRVEPLRARSG